MEQNTKICPYCGGVLPIKARRCKYCGEWLKDDDFLPSSDNQETEEASVASDDSSTDNNVDAAGSETTSEQKETPKEETASTEKKGVKDTPIWKNKKFLIFIGIVLVIGGFIYHQYEKSENEKSYLIHAKAVKSNAQQIVDAADPILMDYYCNWKSAIENDRAYDAEMKLKPCKDFNKAVGWRIEYYSHEIHSLDSLLNGIQYHLAFMRDIPSQYASIDNSFRTVYSTAKALVSLCHQPEGSLRDFGGTMHDAVDEVKNALSESDVAIGTDYTTDLNGGIDMDKIYSAEKKSEKLQ